METIYDLDPATLDEVKPLIRLNHDAHEVLVAAAEAASAPAVVRVFRAAADEHDRLRAELCDAVRLNLADVPEGGTAWGVAHRWWLELRSRLSGGDDAAVLVEAERGEAALLDRYEKAAIETAGSPLSPVLNRHVASVLALRDRVAVLREART